MYSRKQKKVHVLSSYYDRSTERLTVKTLYKRRLNATLRLRSGLENGTMKICLYGTVNALFTVSTRLAAFL